MIHSLEFLEAKEVQARQAMAAGAQGLASGYASEQGLGEMGTEDLYVNPTDIILSFLRLRARVSQWREQGVAFFCDEEGVIYYDI